MNPPRNDYDAPSTLDEAVGILQAQGDEAKPLSGGQSLIPLLKLRLAAPRLLVDLNRIPGLDVLTEENGYLRIGALVREHDIESSGIVRSRYPLLADAAAVVADPVVRNRATLCGNIAHADPANDHPAALLALEATAIARGSAGERAIPVADFFTGLFSTALAPDELLVEVRIPAPAGRTAGAYLKLERKVGDFATAAVAAQVTLADDGTLSRVGIGLTNVGPTAIRARRAEAQLTGPRPGDAALEEAGRLAAEEAQPVADRRGSVEYKRDVVRVLTVRALRLAIGRALAAA